MFITAEDFEQPHKIKERNWVDEDKKVNRHEK